MRSNDDVEMLSFIVLSNATEGDDDEFNEWYTNRHIVDVIEQVAGVRSIQRFRLAGHQRKPGPHAYRYLCVYDVEKARAAEVFATLEERSGTELMPVSKTFASYMPLVFEPIGPKIHQSNFPRKY